MVGNVSTYPDPKEMFSLFLVQFSLQRKEKNCKPRSTHNQPHQIARELWSLQRDESVCKGYCGQLLFLPNLLALSVCAHQSWYKKVGWKMVPNSEEQPFPKHKTLWLLWVWVKSVAIFFPGKSEQMLAVLIALGTREKTTTIFTAWGFKGHGGAGELSPSASTAPSFCCEWYTPSSTCWRWDDRGMKQHHSQLLKPAASIKQPKMGEGMLKQILFGAARYHHTY